MATLNKCLEKAKGKLSEVNIDSVKSIADEYIQDKLTRTEAAKKAVDDVLSDNIKQYNKYVDQIIDQGGFAEKLETKSKADAEIEALDLDEVQDSFDSEPDAQFASYAKLGDTRDVDSLSVEEFAALKRQIDKLADPAKTYELLREMSGTPWAGQAIDGALVRDNIESWLNGEKAQTESKALQAIRAKRAEEAAKNKKTLDNESLFRAIVALENGDAEAIWRYLESNSTGFVSSPSKPEQAINGSFLDCHPSKACAKFCYAASGFYLQSANIIRGEFINWAIKNDPDRAAKQIIKEFNGGKLGIRDAKTGKMQFALQLFDKGDANENWFDVAEKLNDAGIRLHIFSKKPDLLRQFNPMNVRLISVDETNQQLAEGNEDIPLAVVYSDPEKQNEFLNTKTPSQVGVILPVQIGKGESLKNKSRDLARQVPKDKKIKVCPIDAHKGGSRSCKDCDKGVGLGCYNESVTAQIMQSAKEEGITEDQFLENIEKEFEKYVKQTNLTEQQREFLARKLADTLHGSPQGYAGEGQSGSTREPGELPDAQQRVATSKTSTRYAPAKSQTNAKKLNDTLKKDGFSSQKYTEVDLPNTLAGLAASIQKVFGRTVVAVQADPGTQNIFAGVRLKSNPDVVYFNVNSPIGFMNVVGHELMHDLKARNKSVYDWFAKKAWSHMKDLDKYGRTLNASMKNGRELNAGQIQEELLADFMGDALADPNFLQSLHTENRFKFGQLISYVRKWLNTVSKKMRNLGSDKYIKDVDGLREHLKNALEVYAAGGTAADVNGGNPIKFMVAYHGTPHNVDKFSNEKIGTGEGAQAYGYGLYFAESKDVAEWYRDTQTDHELYIDGVRVDEAKSKKGFIPRYYYDVSKLGYEGAIEKKKVDIKYAEQKIKDNQKIITTIEKLKAEGNSLLAEALWEEDPSVLEKNLSGERELLRKIQALKGKNVEIRGTGNLYQVELAPQEDEYLLWDKPLSEQSEKVKDILMGEDSYKDFLNWYSDKTKDLGGEFAWGNLNRDQKRQQAYNWYQDTKQDYPLRLELEIYGDTDGGRFYERLSKDRGSDKTASEYLHSLGIRGIKYLDGSSRRQGDGEYNYVIFNDDDVSITHQNDTPLDTRTANFQNWFGDSKVVDENGEPLVVYRGEHGEENGNQLNSRVSSPTFTPEKYIAGDYAADGENARVGAYYLSMQNPVDLDTGSDVISLGTLKEAINYDSLSSQDKEIFDAAVVALPDWRGWSESPMDSPNVKQIYSASEIPEQGYTYTFNVTDDKNIEGLFKKQGYDGFIYRGPFTANDEIGIIPQDISDDLEINGEVEYKVFDQSQIKSAIGNNGDYDPNNPDIMYRMLLPEDEVVSENVKSRLDGFRYWMQDKVIDLKRKQQEIEADPNADPIADAQNAYQKIAIWESKAGEKLNQFDEGEVQPLLEMIAETGHTMEGIGEFLVARHAEEANAYLYKINPDMGDDLARTHLSGMTNQEAQEIKDKYASNVMMQKVGAEIDRLNNQNLDRAVEAGLMTTELRDTLKATYKHYVPLKRAEAKGDSFWSRGQGFQIKGRESKMRTGAAYWTPTQIVANTLSQIENTIVRAEKNEIGNSLVSLIEQNPDDSFWHLETNPKMRAVVNGKVRDIPDNFDSRNRLTVKRDGKEIHIVFEEDNNEAMRLAAGLKNLQVSEMNTVFKVLSKVNRVLSSLNTTFNPEFVISNFFRDIQTAYYNLSDTELKDMQMRVMKDVPKAMNGIRSELFGDGSAAWTKAWNDFKEAGGKTSWIDVHSDIDKYETKLKDAVERIGEGKDSRSAFGKIIDVVENANIVIENAVRLSAYQNMIQMKDSQGRQIFSKEKAAAMAKDLTVNFNRKGAAGPAMNALYLFYNASIQGSVRMLQAMVHSKKGRMLALGTVGFAVALDMLNRSLSGEDEDGQNNYDALPTYVKHHNLIIMGDQEPIIKIPLPYGYNVLHALGQSVGKAATSDNVNYLEEAGAVGMAALGSFNPVGTGTFLQTLSPTITDMWVMIAENKNFAGIPLKPEHTFDSRNPKPEYLMHWSSASESSKRATKMLNDLTGGDSIEPGWANLSPAYIDLAYSQYLGGLGGFANRMVDFTEKLVSDQEITTSDIPFVRKVTGYNNEYGVKQRYYEWSKNIGYSKLKLKRFKGDELAEARKEPEADLVPLYNAVEKRLRKLRKARKVAERLGNTTRLEKIDQDIKAEMSRFNKAYMKKMFKEG